MDLVMHNLGVYIKYLGLCIWCLGLYLVLWDAPLTFMGVWIEPLFLKLIQEIFCHHQHQHQDHQVGSDQSNFYPQRFPERSVKSITIKTGDEAGAGTDLDVKAKICDGENNCCETPYPLNQRVESEALISQGDDKERYYEDVYTVPAQLGPCGVVSGIESWERDLNCWDHIFLSWENEFNADF